MQDVRKRLGDYMFMEPGNREDETLPELNFFKAQKDRVLEYGERLRQRGVNIQDVNDSPVSRKIVCNIVRELEDVYKITPAITEKAAAGYNIRIIHNDEYYKERGLPDLHEEFPSDQIVQHLTEEQEVFSIDYELKAKRKGFSIAFAKIIQELLLKGDVRDEKVTVFDWNSFACGKRWTFVNRNKLKTEDSNRKEKPHFEYQMVTIYCNGDMTFKRFNDFGIDDSYLGDNESDELVIRRRYDYVESEAWPVQKQVEGLVYSELDNIHAILRTNEITMPNTEAIWFALQGTEGKSAVFKTAVIEALNAFAVESDENATYAAEVMKALDELPEEVTKDDIRKAMNLHKRVAREFNDFLHEEFGIWISAGLKSKSNEERYRLESVKGIKYFSGKYDEKESFCYYVGTKGSLKFSVHNACTIRQVLSTQDSREFKEILPLMAVDFVRYNQYTVVPFPFKYLREFEKIY